MGPHGFWGSENNGYLFSGSWGVLVIIFMDLGGGQAHSFRDLGCPAKKSKKKKSHIKGKAFIVFDCLKKSLASWEGEVEPPTTPLGNLNV